MSAQVCGKKYATPSPSFPVPIPPPHRTHHPSVNCPETMISGLLDHVTSSANGCGAPGAQHRQSVLFRAPLPSCPVPAKPALRTSCQWRKSLSLSEGIGKEYMQWSETSVGKTGTQADGRHVVIRASQG
jgi:hypothetical protein